MEIDQKDAISLNKTRMYLEWFKQSCILIK